MESKVDAAEKIAQNEQDGVGRGVSPSEAVKADKAKVAEEKRVAETEKWWHIA